MNTSLPITFLAVWSACSLACPGTNAQELASASTTGEKVESILPKPFDPEQLTSLIENPPFTRSVNPSDSLVLSGLAFIDGKPVATLFDTATKESSVVSDVPNAKGWTLTEAPAVTDVTRAQAKISIGGEIVSIRYNKLALTPDKLRKERTSGDSRGGPPPGPPQGGDGYQRSGPRPSQEDMDRYRSLSDKARDRLREEFTKNRERLMNATPEERSAFMRSTFERVSKEDQGGGRPSSGGPSSSGPSSSGSGGRGDGRGDGRGPGR
jgi:hypothetical protein